MLTTTQLLKEVGVSRDLLYFWERKGWIKAVGVSRGTKQTGRRWPPEAGQTAKLLQRYYRRGLRPELAYKRAVEELKKKSKR